MLYVDTMLTRQDKDFAFWLLARELQMNKRIPYLFIRGLILITNFLLLFNLGIKNSWFLNLLQMSASLCMTCLFQWIFHKTLSCFALSIKNKKIYLKPLFDWDTKTDSFPLIPVSFKQDLLTQLFF